MSDTLDRLQSQVAEIERQVRRLREQIDALAMETTREVADDERTDRPESHA